MKKGLVIAVIIGIILSTISVACLAITALRGEQTSGSKVMATRTIPAPAFNAIKASRAVDVKIVEATTNQITITADDNIIDHVVVRLEDGKLIATIDQSIQRINNYSVTITVPVNEKIKELKATSAATISSSPVLTADQFKLNASSAAKIEASIKARDCEGEASSAGNINMVFVGDKCELDASSAAKITAQVTATKCNLTSSSAAKIKATGTSQFGEFESSSAGKINATDLIVENLKASASSGANTNVNCSNTLTAEASSGGNIQYTGTYKSVNQNSSSGGSIKKQ